MSETLQNLVKFILDNSPEMHDRGEGVIMFVSSSHIDMFLGIIDFIDDAGYPVAWKGDYFALNLDDFLDSQCDIEPAKFSEMMNAHISKD